jgi:hypothetical protein
MRRASHWLVAGMKIAVIGKGSSGGTLDGAEVVLLAVALRVVR